LRRISDDDHSLTDGSGHDRARVLARKEKNTKTKESLLRIADDYERLAHWVEDWALRRLAKN
jgi:hypothetical protein